MVSRLDDFERDLTGAVCGSKHLIIARPPTNRRPRDDASSAALRGGRLASRSGKLPVPRLPLQLPQPTYLQHQHGHTFFKTFQ